METRDTTLLPESKTRFHRGEVVMHRHVIPRAIFKSARTKSADLRRMKTLTVTEKSRVLVRFNHATPRLALKVTEISFLVPPSNTTRVRVSRTQSHTTLSTHTCVVAARACARGRLSAA